ncbi:hypothetical protein F3Y22_tig00002193pilonHSYRG00077 [Hibiscus syriacus]|uniref:Reverse transcriptase domain-containing protein n=1 Tax=Hibiscus syriacus TaxID=106335 RepID=A0A6A3CS81_HIBSY|nr:hypothetical protein F3Y22_tig00002193pilonHSYRG00077 [Hibiscus syriacus]
MPAISVEINTALTAPYSHAEIHAAFLHVHPYKAPGIDRLPASFFRTFWNLVGEDFLTLCLNLLEGRIPMDVVNETVIVLIPKMASPDHGVALKLDMEKLMTGLTRRFFNLCYYDLGLLPLGYRSLCHVSLRNTQEFSNVRDIIHAYCAASRQLVNFSKSSLYFGANTPPGDRSSLSAILGVNETVDPGMYLGEPLMVGRNKIEAFGFLRDKLLNHVRGMALSSFSIKSSHEGAECKIFSNCSLEGLDFQMAFGTRRSPGWSKITNGRSKAFLASFDAAVGYGNGEQQFSKLQGIETAKATYRPEASPQQFHDMFTNRPHHVHHTSSDKDVGTILN